MLRNMGQNIVKHLEEIAFNTSRRPVRSSLLQHIEVNTQIQKIVGIQLLCGLFYFSDYRRIFSTPWNFIPWYLVLQGVYKIGNEGYCVRDLHVGKCGWVNPAYWMWNMSPNPTEQTLRRQNPSIRIQLRHTNLTAKEKMQLRMRMFPKRKI